MSRRSSRGGPRVSNVLIGVATTIEWAGRCAARSSRCCVWLFPGSTERSAAPTGAVRRRGSGVLRVPGHRAWSAAGVDWCYRHHLDRFEAYLRRIGVTSCRSCRRRCSAPSSPNAARRGWRRRTVRQRCGVLRVFLRYAHREGVLGGDLATVRVAAGLPALRASRGRSPGRRSSGCSPASIAAPPCGKRDYAILLLLVTYGLRGREVAALTLDDIDWKRERLAIPERKAGHSTAFPLSAVGRRGDRRLPAARPAGQPRPARLLPGDGAAAADRGGRGVARCARHYLLKAGVEVPRPGRTRCATPASSVSWTPTSR